MCDSAEQSWAFEGTVVSAVHGFARDIAEQSWAFEGKVMIAVLGLCVTSLNRAAGLLKAEL